MIRPSINEVVSAEAASGDVRRARDTVWLTQQQLADLFVRDRSISNRHLRGLFAKGELDPEPTCAHFAHVQSEGAWLVTMEVDQYSLDFAADRALQEGATAEDFSPVQAAGRRDVRKIPGRKSLSATLDVTGGDRLDFAVGGMATGLFYAWSDALPHKLFSGEIRVPKAARTAQAAT